MRKSLKSLNKMKDIKFRFRQEGFMDFAMFGVFMGQIFIIFMPKED